MNCSLINFASNEMMMAFRTICLLLLLPAQTSSFSTIAGIQSFKPKIVSKNDFSTTRSVIRVTQVRDGSKSNLPPISSTLYASISMDNDGSRGQKIKAGKSSSAAASDLNIEALVYMSLLAIQFGIQPGLVRAFVPETICKSSYLLMQDFLKIIFSCVGFFISGKEVYTKALEGMSSVCLFCDYYYLIAFIIQLIMFLYLFFNRLECKDSTKNRRIPRISLSHPKYGISIGISKSSTPHL